MASHVFTQCACVLLDRGAAVADLEKALDGWEIAGAQAPAGGEEGWAASGPGLVLALRAGGTVLVDLLDRPWPDDPAAGPGVAAAWKAGLFGPCAAPGALARATNQAWTWPGGLEAAHRHRALVRLRTLVVLPADGPPRLPDDHDPVHELSTLTELAGSLLALPGALAAFFPGGEALRSSDQVAAVLRRKSGLGPPPIELWVNLRGAALGAMDDTRWVVADVVGMGQLRYPDQEAIFADGQEDPGAVAPLLRSACLHLLGGHPLDPGSTAPDARGRRWKAAPALGLLAPGRPVMRWLPVESPAPDEALLERLVPGAPRREDRQR